MKSKSPPVLLTPSQMIRHINLTPALNKLWNDMSMEEHRVVIAEAEGETTLLQELMEDIVDRRNVQDTSQGI